MSSGHTLAAHRAQSLDGGGRSENLQLEETMAWGTSQSRVSNKFVSNKRLPTFDLGNHTEHVRQPAGKGQALNYSIQSEGSTDSESPVWGWGQQLRRGDRLREQVVVSGQGNVCRGDHFTWKDR